MNRLPQHVERFESDGTRAPISLWPNGALAPQDRGLAERHCEICGSRADSHAGRGERVACLVCLEAP